MELHDNTVIFLVILLVILFFTVIVLINSCYSSPKDKDTTTTNNSTVVSPVVEHAFLTNVDNKILSNCDKTKISLQRYYIPSLEDSYQLDTYTPISQSNLYKFPHKHRNNIISYNDNYADGTPMYKIVENNLDSVPRCRPKYMGHML